MKQTAVEWLVDELILEGFYIPKGFYDKAKAMEKAEKDKQYQRGFKDGSKHIKIIYNL